MADVSDPRSGPARDKRKAFVATIEALSCGSAPGPARAGGAVILETLLCVNLATPAKKHHPSHKRRDIRRYRLDRVAAVEASTTGKFRDECKD